MLAQTKNRPPQFPNRMSIILFVLITLPGLAGCLSYQQGMAMRRELDAIKTSQSSLADSSKSQQENTKQSLAESYATLEDIQQQFATINGRLEENRHALSQQQEYLDKFAKDIALKIEELETQIQSGSGTASAERSTDSATKKKFSRGSGKSAGSAYDQGRQLLEAKKPGQARQSFTDFIRNSPKHKLADNAQYWIGETYYAERKFDKAILAFQTVLDRYPKSDKRSDALLKQGFSFAELGLYDDAEAFLKKVVSSYPKSANARRAEQKIRDVENDKKKKLRRQTSSKKR